MKRRIHFIHGSILWCAAIFGAGPADSQIVESDTLPASHMETYGVRWKLIENEATDYFLPCERVEDATGLSMESFDTISPWSEIKRCNIQERADGTHAITYEHDLGFTLDGSKGNVMVEVPKHYCRRYLHDGYEYRLISTRPREGFVVDPAFVENGVEVEKIYVAAYEAHISKDGKMESLSGVYPTANYSRPEYRSFARVNGRGYGTFDIRTLLMIQNLFLIEHAERDSQKAVGGGWGKIRQPHRTNPCVLPEKGVNRIVTKGTSFPMDLFTGCAVTITSYETGGVLDTGRTLTDVVLNSPEEGLVSLYFDGAPIDTTTEMCLGGAAQKTGWADRLPSHTGHTDYNGNPPGTEYRCAVKYRHMENLWGNLWCFIDGLNLDHGRSYLCENMALYEDGIPYPAYKPVGITQQIQTENGNIGGDLEIHYLKNLGYDPNNPWLALPQDFMNAGKSSLPGASKLLRNAHFGDYYYLSATAKNYVSGGGFDHYWRCGLFTLRGWQDDTRKWYLYGSRMIYKPL